MTRKFISTLASPQLMTAIENNFTQLILLQASDLVSVINTPQVIRCSSDTPFPYSNMIVYVNVNDTDAIETIIADYPDGQSLWFLSPLSSRDIAKEGLLANGFTLIEERPIFAAKIEDVLPNTVPAFEVIQVESIQQRDDWISIQSKANGGFTPDVLDVYRASLDNVINDTRIYAYVAYDDGKPVGCAILLLSDGVAGFYQLAVDPDERRRGIATALAAHRMQVALENGYQIVGMTVTAMGKTIHSKLGFKEIGKVHMYMQV